MFISISCSCKILELNLPGAFTSGKERKGLKLSAAKSVSRSGMHHKFMLSPSNPMSTYLATGKSVCYDTRTVISTVGRLSFNPHVRRGGVRATSTRLCFRTLAWPTGANLPSR